MGWYNTDQHKRNFMEIWSLLNQPYTCLKIAALRFEGWWGGGGLGFHDAIIIVAKCITHLPDLSGNIQPCSKEHEQ